MLECFVLNLVNFSYTNEFPFDKLATDRGKARLFTFPETLRLTLRVLLRTCVNENDGPLPKAAHP